MYTWRYICFVLPIRLSYWRFDRVRKCDTLRIFSRIWNISRILKIPGYEEFPGYGDFLWYGNVRGYGRPSIKREEILVEIQDMEIFHDIDNIQDMEMFQDMEVILDIEIIPDMEVKHHTIYHTSIGRRKQIYCQE